MVYFAAWHSVNYLCDMFGEFKKRIQQDTVATKQEEKILKRVIGMSVNFPGKYFMFYLERCRKEPIN